MPNHVVERITDFNRGRQADLLAQKYKQMRQDPFSFFRGTCHLFYEDWPADSPLNGAPLTWICGDLHPENLGSYKGNNRLVYFDIVDFDEAVLAPCTWDLARLLTSLFVAGHALDIADREAEAVCRYGLDRYAAALLQGQIRWVERPAARGIVRELTRSLRRRKPRELLRQRTRPNGKKLRLKIDSTNYLPAGKAEHRMVEGLIDRWRIEQPDPDFYRVLDVADHAAGTGSLGLEHYTILAAGKHGSGKPHLLTLKAAPVSSLERYLPAPQPSWKFQAERVATAQRLMPATPPAYLDTLVADNGTSYILREHQPHQDRVHLGHWRGKPRRLENLIGTVGEIVAWDQLRSTGRLGSAIADHLVAFAQAPDWREQLLAYARRYHRQVLADYGTFCAAYDAGKLMQ